jgi:hypothetical protein
MEDGCRGNEWRGDGPVHDVLSQADLSGRSESIHGVDAIRAAGRKKAGLAPGLQ